MDILTGHDATVLDWASVQMNGEVGNPQVVFGVLDKEGTLIGALLYGEFDGHNCEMGVCGTKGFLPGIVRFAFDYPFNHRRCGRIWARIRRSNKRQRKLLPRLGFTYEGAERNYYGDENALRYSMLKNECKWIDHGIETETGNSA